MIRPPAISPAGGPMTGRRRSRVCSPRCWRPIANSPRCATTFRSCWPPEPASTRSPASSTRCCRRSAPAGPTSEQLRRMILRLEGEIRQMLTEGARGTLSELWDQASDRLASTSGAAFAQTVRIGRAAIEVDGPCVDCDGAAAANIIGHLWQTVQDGKARRFRAVASRLALKLEDILRAEFIRSPAGRSAGSLQASVGAPHHALFDFQAMAALLPQPSTADTLPEARRRRIEWALWVLKRQRFFAAAVGQGRAGEVAEPYSFRFENCADAGRCLPGPNARHGRTGESSVDRRAGNRRPLRRGTPRCLLRSFRRQRPELEGHRSLPRLSGRRGRIVRGRQRRPSRCFVHRSAPQGGGHRR